MFWGNLGSVYANAGVIFALPTSENGPFFAIEPCQDFFRSVQLGIAGGLMI